MNNAEFLKLFAARRSSEAPTVKQPDTYASGLPFFDEANPFRLEMDRLEGEHFDPVYAREHMDQWRRTRQVRKEIEQRQQTEAGQERINAAAKAKSDALRQRLHDEEAARIAAADVELERKRAR